MRPPILALNDSAVLSVAKFLPDVELYCLARTSKKLYSILGAQVEGIMKAKERRHRVLQATERWEPNRWYCWKCSRLHRKDFNHRFYDLCDSPGLVFHASFFQFQYHAAHLIMNHARYGAGHGIPLDRI